MVDNTRINDRDADLQVALLPKIEREAAGSGDVKVTVSKRQSRNMLDKLTLEKTAHVTHTN